MRQHTNGFVIMLVAVLALTMSVSYAQAKKQHHRHQHRNHAAMRARLFKNITLTADQKTSFKNDFHTFAQAARAWRKEHGAAARELHQRMKEARQDQDRQKLKGLRQQWRQLVSSRPKIKDTLAKMRDKLTPDQQKQFDTNLKQIHEERRKAREQRRDHGKRQDHGKRRDHGKRTGAATS